MNREQYEQQFAQFSAASIEAGLPAPLQRDQNAILDDDRPSHDEKDFSFDYWAHCSWAARKIAESCGIYDEWRLKRHIDFGSYCYFAGLASAFVSKFTFVDIRGLPNTFENLTSRKLDMAYMPEIETSSCESVSCLHVLEHIGLGRYGDKLNPLGDKWAANELKRILAPGGRLIIVLPMSEDQNGVYFNAHRIYSLEQVRALFSGLAPVSFEYIYGDKICSGPVPTSGHYTGLMVFSK